MVWNFKSRLAGGSGRASAGTAALAELQGQTAALDRALAVAEFDIHGKLLKANDNFLRTLGYRGATITGQSHSQLVPPSDRDSSDYRRLWDRLASGECVSGHFRHLGQDGREVRVVAHYVPVADAAGKPCSVTEYASTVSAGVTAGIDDAAALARIQQVLKTAAEGDLTGRVDTAQLFGEPLVMAHAVNQLLSAIGNTIGGIQRAASAATDGQLSARVDVRGATGELRKASEAVNHLLESVAEIVANVKAASSEVLRGAVEISDGSMNLSQRTEEQSASLEETASSMEEMTSTVKQNADNAGQASQLAMAARDQAENGGSVVGKAVEAMAKINEASTKIAAIIGVIDDIAFQTNLLALNAAVEAARAGEQGRGFAVVATEVRTLAGRSATAAKEIKELIQDSVRKVDDGSTLVTQSGHTLDQIVKSVKKVSDIVAEIAAASREQHAGIEQVNKAILQMDGMTQQNAALVEQATAASQSVAAQARQLTKLTERYDGGTLAGAYESAPAAGTPVPERRSAGRRWATQSPANGSARGATAAAAGSAAKSKATGGRKAAGSAAAKAGDPEWLEF